MPNPVEVVVQIGRDEVLAGRLWTHRRGARESATFTYERGLSRAPRRLLARSWSAVG